MKIVQIRDKGTANSTMSELFVNDLHFSWTIERPRGYVNKEGHTCPLPAGTYPIEMDVPSLELRQRFKPPLTTAPKFLNTPNGIEGAYCHPGNRAEDSEMCVCPGYEKDVDFVGNSRTAFDDLCGQIRNALSHGNVAWEIRDPFA